MTKTAFYIAAHALIKANGKYLVIKRAAENDYMPLKWDLPGGQVEAGETVVAALKREIFEETKLEVEIGTPIFVYTNLACLPSRQTIQIVFICETKYDRIALNLSEHTEYKWVNYEEMRALDCIPYLEELVHTIAPLKQSVKE